MAAANAAQSHFMIRKLRFFGACSLNGRCVVVCHVSMRLLFGKVTKDFLPVQYGDEKAPRSHRAMGRFIRKLLYVLFYSNFTYASVRVFDYIYA